MMRGHQCGDLEAFGLCRQRQAFEFCGQEFQLVLVLGFGIYKDHLYRLKLSLSKVFSVMS